MNTEIVSNRRHFLTSALSALAMAASVDASDAQPEVPNYSGDVPPGATLWGFVVFTADEPVEVSIAAGDPFRLFET